MKTVNLTVSLYWRGEPYCVSTRVLSYILFYILSRKKKKECSLCRLCRPNGKVPTENPVEKFSKSPTQTTQTTLDH